MKNPCLLPYLVLDHNKKSTVVMGVGETLRQKGAGIREKGGGRGERELKIEMVWVFGWVLAIPCDLVMDLPLAGDGIDDTWFVLVGGRFVCFDRCFGC